MPDIGGLQKILFNVGLASNFVKSVKWNCHLTTISVLLNLLNGRLVLLKKLLNGYIFNISLNMYIFC